MSTTELGRRLQRDPSLISRLYAAYAAKREVQGEAQLASGNKSILMPDPYSAVHNYDQMA